MKILTILIILIIIIGIIVGLVFLYYNHEKPLQEKKIAYRDVNIKIIDSSSNENIISNYTIGDGSQVNIYKNGTSLKNDYVVEKLPENHTFYVSSNYMNDNYYNNYQSVNTYQPGPFRVDIPLTQRGNLSILYNGNFGVNNNFDLTLNKVGELRNLQMCILYSIRIIALYNNNSLIETTKLSNYNRYFKCFNVPNFNSTTTLNFNYLYFGTIDSQDYINFIFFDNDINLNSPHKEFYVNVTKTN